MSELPLPVVMHFHSMSHDEPASVAWWANAGGTGSPWKQHWGSMSRRLGFGPNVLPPRHKGHAKKLAWIGSCTPGPAYKVVDLAEEACPALDALNPEDCRHGTNLITESLAALSDHSGPAADCSVNISTAVNSQNAVSVYFTSKQIPPFGCAQQSLHTHLDLNHFRDFRPCDQWHDINA